VNIPVPIPPSTFLASDSEEDASSGDDFETETESDTFLSSSYVTTHALFFVCLYSLAHRVALS
jgi:hypothetical protein